MNCCQTDVLVQAIDKIQYPGSFSLSLRNSDSDLNSFYDSQHLLQPFKNSQPESIWPTYTNVPTYQPSQQLATICQQTQQNTTRQQTNTKNILYANSLLKAQLNILKQDQRIDTAKRIEERISIMRKAYEKQIEHLTNLISKYKQQNYKQKECQLIHTFGTKLNESENQKQKLIKQLQEKKIHLQELKNQNQYLKEQINGQENKLTWKRNINLNNTHNTDLNDLQQEKQKLKKLYNRFLQHCTQFQKLKGRLQKQNIFYVNKIRKLQLLLAQKHQEEYDQKYRKSLNEESQITMASSSVCAQMLSPQQTIDVLSDILQKVIKSDHLMKKLRKSSLIKKFIKQI